MLPEVKLIENSKIAKHFSHPWMLFIEQFVIYIVFFLVYDWFVACETQRKISSLVKTLTIFSHTIFLEKLAAHG